ncbi:NAD(P)-dependent oxidoreductase [Oceanobacillus jeddahense]|uniref:DUF1932 domain-containing protein n=1 Tax=Oceanobacillus jeddahense TaxID=1462527 RepID=A0ABY5JQQ0_9BACI|nr:DUF1932 domain-containing protein [Oceanobacillus jeddahense]UUI02446.1 DUF1932 domain-containing protein [Oceanobacillus jeddahense]
MNEKLNIGIIGFGEAGYEFAKSFNLAGYNIIIYDVLVESQPDVINEKARNISALVAMTIHELVVKADAIFVFTSSTVCVKIAEVCAESIKNDQFYIDCNSASPQTKQKAWEAIYQHPKFVDLAVMGPVPGKGIKVPMTTSGPGASSFQKQFENLNQEIKIVDELPGSAALIKLSRSSFMKGLAALLLETIALSETNKVTEAVLDSLVETIGEDFEPLIARLVKGTHQHATRREKEMDAVIELQEAVGQQTLMTQASKQILHNIANHNRIENETMGDLSDYYPHIVEVFHQNKNLSL